MRYPPKQLAEVTIVKALEANFGLSISTLAFLPLGADSASAAYRVQTTDGTVLFLKVRKGKGFSASSLVIPRYLHDRGVPHILAPMPTAGDVLWVSVDNFALSLAPFIEGSRAADVGLSGKQWIELGVTLKQIHTSRLAHGMMEVVPRESFMPTRRDILTKLQAAIARQNFTDPVQQEWASFWMSRRERIGTLVDRCDGLGRQLRHESATLVLCHADLHTWNVLLDTDQQLWLVDWDETILALKERDLMFFVGGIGRDLVRPQETAFFLQGYGDTAIDPRALAYYRYAWVLQDIAAFGEKVFFLPDLGEESRHDALDSFVDMFEPGNIVAIALASDVTGE